MRRSSSSVIPTWTVQQVKSALASTGNEVHPTGRSGEVSVLREGGGRIDLVRANQPLIFTDPTSLGWGLVRRGFSGTKKLSTADAGGGSAPWRVSIHAQSLPRGAKLEPLAKTLVAGDVTRSAAHGLADSAARATAPGFVVLTRGTDVRRVAFWFHVEVPRLGLDPHRTLRAPGLYHGDTAGKASRVSSYRYPQRGLALGSADAARRAGAGLPVHRCDGGSRTSASRSSATRRGSGSRRASSPTTTRTASSATPGMPAALNPYQGFYRAEPVVGAVLPDPGTYEFVFDTPTGKKPGSVHLPLLGQRHLTAVDPAARRAR